MNKKEALEQERDKLHRLITKGASKEEIQHQSEVLDKHIGDYYSTIKEREIHGNYLE